MEVQEAYMLDPQRDIFLEVDSSTELKDYD
jgi:hypothetical protein